MVREGLRYRSTLYTQLLQVEPTCTVDIYCHRIPTFCPSIQVLICLQSMSCFSALIVDLDSQRWPGESRFILAVCKVSIPTEYSLAASASMRGILFAATEINLSFW